MIILNRVVRDNDGVLHKPGEQVIVVGSWYEIGTHRVLLRAELSGKKLILLPDDVKADSATLNLKLNTHKEGPLS